MIGVIGSGSWGTAIVKILLEKENREINWWVRSKEVEQSLKKWGRNSHHLSGLHFDKTRIHPSSNITETVSGSDLLIVAVPSAYIASCLEGLDRHAFDQHSIASAVKGYVPETGCSVSQYMQSVWGVKPDRMCVVSGPSHAEEVAAGQCTFLDVASSNTDLATRVADALRCSYVHCSTGSDVATLELCGLGKNVYAIGAGIASALGHGDNLCAVLTAAAAHELQNLTGCITPTFPLLGDLVVTCFSQHSRNRALGQAVVSGIAPEEHFRRTGMVAEGYYSALAMHNMAKNAPTPIAEAIYRILYQCSDPKTEMQYLIDNIF